MRYLFARLTLRLATFAAAAPPAGLLDELHLETNIARQKHGAQMVRVSETLAKVAQGHAEEMANLGFFSHQSPTPERSTLGVRLAAGGETALWVAENLAFLSPRPELAAAAVEGWLESPGHREALLKPRFTHVGFGAATGENGGVYIVQVFAWKPWLLQGGKVTNEAGQRRVELTYDRPLGDVAVFVDGENVPAVVRGNRVELPLGEGQAEVHVALRQGREALIFDAIRVAADNRLMAGRSTGLQ